jgi:hypothetical protein
VEDSGDARRDGDQVNPVWIYPFRFAQLN